MTNGLGAILGGLFAGKVVDYFSDAAGTKNWPSIWFTFAAYALVIAVLFLALFKYKHNPKEVVEIRH
jgi:MFS transporter, NHS family, xanthosine permease